MHNEGQEDMSAPITKADLLEVAARLGSKIDGLDGKVEGLDSKIDRVEHSLRRDMALGFDQARAERERFDGALNAKIDKRHFDTVSRMDAFMSQTLAARNDQSILIHRVDKLEERVDRLESGK